MGSKTPANKEKRDNTCEVCNLKFLTVQALRSHQSARHTRQVTSVAKQQEESPNRVISPASRPTSTPNPAAVSSSRVSKRLQLKKVDVETEQSETSQLPNNEEQTNKIHFVCPKCFKVFAMYFQAFKHIQKKHCEDILGNQVSPDSPDMIKPARVETCTKCKQQVDSSHLCNLAPEVEKWNTFFCLGCDEQFLSVGMLNKHVANTHHNNIDSMFFKTFEEFNLWKERMEAQVRIKYLTLNQSLTQKYYQCNYVSKKNESNRTYLCPSQISVKELSYGIQIHYNKEHFGHTCPKYELPQEFCHYLTNKKNSSFDNLIQKDPDDDLYIKFINLMKNISRDAAKVSISHLEKVFDSALKIQALLNSYDEDQGNEIPLISKSITDDQIADALEGKRTSARLKRKSETRVSVDAKKKKVDKTDSDDLNPKSIKDENENKPTSKENKQLESPKVTLRSTSALLSPSFNDSYKQFIGNAEPTKDTAKKIIKNTKRKEIVKTKIGQFSPKKKSPNVDAVVETPKTKPNVLKQPKISQFSPKNKSSNDAEVVETPNSIPNILKPLRITQFSPKKNLTNVDQEVATPKRLNILKPHKTNTSINAGKDIKYEVREQDNDCNILILKI